MKTFIKTIFKCISNNKSRFISMSLIILVGICFVTGLGEEWVKSELEKQNLAVNQVYVGEYLNGQLVTHLYENK